MLLQKKKNQLFLLLCITSLLASLICVFYFKYATSYLPKPYGYNHLLLPAHDYQSLPDSFPYQFEFSKHALLMPDRSSQTEPYWINIHYPQFQADILLTYKSVHNNQTLLKDYLEDAYKLTTKHQVKADAIDEHIVTMPKGLQAVVVTLSGQVPTPFQFYTTDSTHHFLRGALYFQTALKDDSLAPVVDFIQKDILHMLYTLEWKKAHPPNTMQQ
eukprot:gene762-944_t